MADIKVRLGSQNAIKVVSSISGTTGTLEGLDDVNIVLPTGGELLVYNGQTHKWDSTKYLTLDPATAPHNDGNLPANQLGINQIEINGGNF